MKTLKLIAMILLVSTSTHAGIHADLKVGYNFESYDFKGIAGSGASNLKGTLNGLAAGARLVYSFGMPFFGVDVDYMTLKEKDDTATTEYDSTRTAAFGIIGADFLGGLQAFLGFSFMDSRVTKSTSETTVSGSTAKAGLNFRLAPMLKLGVEYHMHTADKIKTPTAEYVFTNLYTSGANTGVLATLIASF